MKAVATQAGPNTKPDPDFRVRMALDRAATRVAGKFNRRPLLEASIRQRIGETNRDLGLYPDAQRQIEQALSLRRAGLGFDHPETLTSADALGELFWRRGQYARSDTSTPRY